MFISTLAENNGVCVSTHDLSLNILKSPSTTACVWQRPAIPMIEEFVSLWWHCMPEAWHLSCTLEELQASVSGGLSPWQSLHPQGWLAFCRDLTLLGTYFFELGVGSELNLSLQKINEQMCPRFHADHNHFRLLCTYLGAGTIWTPADNVHWEGQGAASRVCHVDDEERIHQLQPFDVIIMKGRRHPDLQGRGQVHRSPPVAAEQPRRLLFKIESV